MISLSEAELELLEAFERGLDPRWPERSEIPARVLGYGEISTVFAIGHGGPPSKVEGRQSQAKGLEGLAFKRLPLFHNAAEVEAYQIAYEEYNRLLNEEIGLRLPAFSYVSLANQARRPIFYIIQQQLPSSSIGNQALHLLPTDTVQVLVRRVLQELRRVWVFNQRQERLQVAIDGQISNWAIEGFDPQAPHVDQDTALTYLDTSTPLYRVEGVEQLDAELFLRSAPSFLAWILRLLFLEDVVNRYYDFHRVAVDLVANFYKEQRPDLIPGVVGVVNDFFANEAAELDIEPVTEKEIRSYYREDAMIWRLYLSMRRFDRLIRTKILRQEYPYILPGQIKR
jgi:hypothetical protein